MDPQPSIQGVITNSLESENRPINLSSNNSSLEGNQYHNIGSGLTSSMIYQPSCLSSGEVAVVPTTQFRGISSHSPQQGAVTNRPRLPLKKAYRKHNSLQEMEHQCEGAKGMSPSPCPAPHVGALPNHHHHHSLQRQASFDLETNESNVCLGPSIFTSHPVQQGSIPSLSSMEIKARLKECVLTRRRTQGLQVERSLSSQTSSFESTEGAGSTDSSLRPPIRPITCSGVQESVSSARWNSQGHRCCDMVSAATSATGLTSSASGVSHTSRKRSRCGETMKLTRQVSYQPYIKIDGLHVPSTGGQGDHGSTHISFSQASPLPCSMGSHLLRKTSSEPNLITPAGSQTLQLLSLTMGFPQQPVLVETSQEISSTSNEESRHEDRANGSALVFVQPHDAWAVRQSPLLEDASSTPPEMVLSSQCVNFNRLATSSLHSRAQQWRYRRQQMRQCYSDEHQHHAQGQSHPLHHSSSSQHPQQPIFLSQPHALSNKVIHPNHLLPHLTQFVQLPTGAAITSQSSSHKGGTSLSSIVTQPSPPSHLLNAPTSFTSHAQAPPLNIILSQQPHLSLSTSQQLDLTALSLSTLLPKVSAQPCENSVMRSVSYSPISSDESVSRHALSDVDWDIWSMKHTDVVNMRMKTGLACDAGMLAHRCLCGHWNDPSVHPECPARLISICKRLQSTDLLSKCVLYSAPPISLDVVRLIHGPRHPTVLEGTLLLVDSLLESSSLQSSPYSQSSSCTMSLSCPTSPNQPPPLMAEAASDNGGDVYKHGTAGLRQWWQQHHKHLPGCGGLGVDSDTYWHPDGTLTATLLATGQIVSLMNKVWRGDLANGFALIRPPGHHAESEQALGYCYVNHLAVACATLLQGYSTNLQSLIGSPCISGGSMMADKPSRILLVDWDVHHGNGTQVVFQHSAEVLYISLHRHEEGSFFPGTGGVLEVGQGDGAGYTINIAWDVPSAEMASESKCGLGDAEYLAAFRTIVLPVAKAFQPQLVAVSAGFDAAEGHSDSLGGYRVSPACFAWMTRQLHEVAEEGRVVLSLEGGYNLDSLATCVHACVESLVVSASKLDPSKSSQLYFEADKTLKASSWQISEEEIHRVPCVSAQNTLLSVMETHAERWPCLKSEYLRSDVHQSMAQSESNKQLTHLFACLHVHNR